MGEDGIPPVQAVGGDRAVTGLTVEGTGVGKGRKGDQSESVKSDTVGTKKTNVLGDAVQVCFEMDDNTGKMVARLKDSTTGEVLRQIPPEEMLKIAKMVNQFLGICVDRHS